MAVSKHRSVYMRTLQVLTCGVFFCFPPLSESGRAKKRLPGTFSGQSFPLFRLFSSHVIPLSATWNSA
ncbi:hypothetical protein ERG27_01915 [Bacillus amyloliquefaciens]|nr:hypothetical protein [Bacillus amyloliquefaciens]QBK09961.1 hypothetical protein EYB46_08305 [Bacillus velezensis]QJC40859.1 hypothetical protein FHJ82_02030 [Bacillus sp. HNA3]GFR56312.1 hypothetical protein BCBMB205_03710 [Bacillus sp. CN2]QEX96724.1 hypothetical protein F6467_02030 [Bacillus velezensis]